jgi:acetyltransferase-like isoleucine patch superfamily enzyme
MNVVPDHPYCGRFKRCGRNVLLAPDVEIEHPDVWEVGDNVTIHRGCCFIGRPREVVLGSAVTFYPNCFVQGDSVLAVDEHVEFFPGNYLSLGNLAQSCIRIGHHSHFAPHCVLYGWGGLRIGPYCNIASHTVFATVGHHEEITDRPMALTGEKAGPIELVEDVWIAANCTITANTVLARGCVIAANAVVTRNTEVMGVYAGVPAKWLRARGTGRQDRKA